MTILFIQSHYQDPFNMGAEPFAEAVAQDLMTVVRETDLRDEHFATARGLITTTHLDQIGFQRFIPAVTGFLDHGGRWIYNGHILRPVLPELSTYIPMPQPRRADLVQTRVFDHPVFAGVDQTKLETNHGVAGFYGRGHNPLPAGAVAINVFGPSAVPVDWIWKRPDGGELLSHAGNEFWGCGDDTDVKRQLADRAVAWLCGILN
ncbi:hypothetical protein [Rhizobium herbae]|uniref:ThuA-like domain-containing protein n=1 Tax=Rhizobium herbae TaxID=508661 RepID=A0ABS4ERC6_9HYPH|nr:hypothetical protein [Rhizobium herbae]MBP1860497.1 hypothetical protein [Rhizobium herbae]